MLGRERYTVDQVLGITIYLYIVNAVVNRIKGKGKSTVQAKMFTLFLYFLLNSKKKNLSYTYTYCLINLFANKLRLKYIRVLSSLGGSKPKKQTRCALLKALNNEYTSRQATAYP